MAIAFSHAGSGSVKAGTTASATVTINANDTVVVAISILGNTSPSSVHDTGGSVYTLKRAINNGTGDRIEFWSTAAGAALASTSVTVQFAAATTYVVSAATYTGVTALGIFSASGSGANFGSNTAPQITLPTEEQNNWIVMGVAGNGISTFSASAPNNFRTSAVTAGGAASTNEGGAIFDAAWAEVGLNDVIGTLSAAETWAASGIELRSSAGPNYSYLCGFEFDSLGEFNAVTGAPTIQSATVHGGGFAMRCNTTATTAFVTFAKNVSPAVAAIQKQTIFCSVRFYLFINSLPSAQTRIYSGAFEGVSFFQGILLNTNGTLTIEDGAGVTASTSALSTGAWHRISLEVNPSDGSNIVKIFVDGTLGATVTSTAGNTADYDTAFLGVGIGSTPATCDLFFDDVLWASDDAVIGSGQQVLLLPTADSSIGNWTAGAGGVTNLWQAENHIPPVGLASGSETNTSQIKNANATVPSDYTATFQSYSAKGVTAGSTVNAIVVACADGFESAAASTLGTSWVASNPVQTPLASPFLFPYGGNGGIVGTYPTGWNTDEGQVATNPVVTLSTAPTASVRKSTSSTIADDVCLVGIYVDYKAPSASPVWNMPFLPGFGNGR
jgi:hypothetical protein